MFAAIRAAPTTVKRVDDGTKVQKRTNKVKEGKQPKVSDEKLTEKERGHFFPL